MRESAEDSCSVYVRPDGPEESVQNAEWALKLPAFDDMSLMPDTFDSWAKPTSKYQRSFGIPPTDAANSGDKRELSMRSVSDPVESPAERLQLVNSSAFQSTSPRKFRLSRSPLDNLQAEFRRYGNSDSLGKMHINQQRDYEYEGDAALNSLDWSFVQRRFELPEHPKVSDCPSMTTGSTISSRNSSTRSTKSCKTDGNEQQDKEMCPIPSCRRVMRDLPAHLLTHQAERPEKCPVEICEYHTKGFARTYDKVRHTLTHFKGTFLCDFCPSSDPVGERTFPRCDIFLRHLVGVHRVEQVPPARREELYRTGIIKQPRRPLGNQSVATCTLCTEPFDVQGFYEHLRGCVLRQVTNSYAKLSEYTGALPNDLHTAGFKRRTHNNHSVTSIEKIPTVSASTSINQHNRSMSDGYPPASLQYCIKPILQDQEIAELTASSRCLSLTSSHGDAEASKSSSEEETDWTDEIGSPDSTPDADGLSPMLSPVKKHLVDSIMVEFHKIFDKMLRSHQGGGGSSSGTGSGSGLYKGSSGSSTYSSSSFISRKRSLSGGGSPPPNDNGDDPHKRRRPDPKFSGGKQSMSELRFACPYYKRNPGRHQTFTSCRDPGFITVARLKEHLYRRHLLPIQCHRCCSTFTNEPTLREHQRDARGCEVKEHVPLEGFDKDQERKLKSKKRSLVYLSEEDKWKGVYRILFPDDNEEDMPSPYIEYQPCNSSQSSEPSTITQFQDFSRLELPRLVRQTLEVVVEQESQPLEEKLKERLVDIVRECQSQLISMFQSTQTKSVDTSELTPTLLPAVTGRVANGIYANDGPRSEHSFQNFDSFALAVTSSDFIPIPATQYPALEHENHKQEASDSPDSGYDSTWTAGSTLPFQHRQQPQQQHQRQEPHPPSFQLNSSPFNPGYPPQQPQPPFMHAHSYAETQFVDLHGYYGLFEAQNQTQPRDVGFVGGTADPSWTYLDPTAGRGRTNNGTGQGM